MIELPDKFEAVDPVSGESFDLRVSYDCFRWHVKDTGHVLASYRASMIRALIQYGRDLERASVIETMENFRTRTDVENEGDLLLDIMDEIVGWCSPKGKKSDDPNHPRGKPHKWEPGFLERIASLPKPPNDGSD